MMFVSLMPSSSCAGGLKNMPWFLKPLLGTDLLCDLLGGKAIRGMAKGE